MRDGRLYGLGTADMKGAVASMTFAAGDRRADLAGDLVLMFTADEEEGSAYGARWLAEQGMISAGRRHHRRAVGHRARLGGDPARVARSVLFRVDIERHTHALQSFGSARVGECER